MRTTTSGTVRARRPAQIISEIVQIPTGAIPIDSGTQINKVVAGGLSVRTGQKKGRGQQGT